MIKLLFVGASCKLQPRPPKQRLFGKQGSKKLRVLTARRETVPSSGTLFMCIRVCIVVLSFGLLAQTSANLVMGKLRV